MERFKYEYAGKEFMVQEDVSRKVVVVLLVLTITISVLGTFMTLNAVDNARYDDGSSNVAQGTAGINILPSSRTNGEVGINILPSTGDNNG